MLKHIVIVVASFRKKSFNRQLANLICELIDSRAKISYLNFESIPYMNQDLEKKLPVEIGNLKKKVYGADGLWIVTPEYNYSYPGLLKNLLDWLSRPFIPNDFSSGTALLNKKTTVSGAAGHSAAKGSLENLNQLLLAMGCKVMKDFQVGVALSSNSFKTDKLILSENDIKKLRIQVDEFLKFINEN
ncbi:MAG: NAD(P)H-dependent oxidoreductase [Spirochaetaceae bacterium]|nr:NAD(P)H-dependent oxidoreductase [Spirochaetaceae bacterium]